MKRTPQASFIPWRFYSAIFFIFLLVFGLALRVIDLSIMERAFLKHEGDLRSLRVVNTPAFRGVITDRNGYPLAVSTSVYAVWINPQDFNVSEDSMKAVCELLSLDTKKINKLISDGKQKKREFVYLKRGVTPETADKIKHLLLPGIYLQENYKRYYPEAEVASHIIGFTNVDDKGQEGLELAYDQWLSGTAGKKMVVKDRRGRVISDVQSMQEQKSGNDLVLSIDKRIQYLAYRELMAGIQQNVAVSGTVVVLNVQTGEILAMVNQPSFNPNNRAATSKDVYRNRAITDTFEPGSTIKAFSIASALDSGLYKPETLIDTTPGWMRVDRRLVRDEHNNKVISVAQVMQVSSNVGTTKMVLSLQPNQLWSLLHRVGFGDVTGVGFPGEQSGSLVRRNKWSNFTLATLAFGYGISVTPLQLAQAYSILANDGLKVPVSLLKVTDPPKSERVITQKVAKQMRDLLESVVTTKGATGELARVPGYRVAGKTGTAIMAGPGGYMKHRYTSSFIGMAPASKPKLVVAVIIHDPKGKHYYASFVSAPVFEKIMEGSLRILNIPPDGEKPV